MADWRTNWKAVLGVAIWVVVVVLGAAGFLWVLLRFPIGV